MADPITLEQALAAVPGTGGLHEKIAENLQCDRSNIYHLCQKWKTLATAIANEKESQKDRVESKLFNLIEDGNPTAIIFYLKTQAKDRGYIEKQDISVQVENELNKALDLLEKKLLPEEYQRVIGVLAGSEDSQTEIKVIPAKVG